MPRFLPAWMVLIVFLLPNNILSLANLKSHPENLFYTEKNCGLRPLIGAPGESRIVGGRVAAEGAWPWMVSIWLRNVHLCGGAILNKFWILSAAHCFEKFRHFGKSNFLVVAGSYDLTYFGVQVQVRTITDMILHEDFQSETLDSDMMLILLGSSLSFTDYVQPICVPRNVTHEVLLNLSHCYISGWGSTHFEGNVVKKMREAEVELIDTKKCNKFSWYNNMISKDMLCAGWESGKADACLGDSGGPLQCYSEREKRFYLLGVSSFGKKCGLPRKPGVYSRVSRFSKWLNATQGKFEVPSIANKTNVAHILILLSLFSALKCTVW